jgi:phosphoribosylanthranilate isomerase
MFRVKICGLTSVGDALLAARSGADAIGLNFYPQSARCVDIATARQIAQALPAGVVKVGLFVNAAAADVCRTFDDLGLDLIQLHGDEPPDYLPLLGGRPVMRALRLGSGGLTPIIAYLDECRRLECLPRMTLVDACVMGQYGGTGQSPDWNALSPYHAETWLPPLVLAGGLTLRNVVAAIHAVIPAAVDVSSGVESAPGRKDPAAVEAFVQAARAALAALGAVPRKP